MESTKIHPNKRREDESFEDYKNRLRAERKAEQVYSRGVLVWNSKLHGTYIKKRYPPFCNEE